MKADGPGTFALYNYDGLPDAFGAPQNAHAHGGWAFGKEGLYRLTVTMSATLADGTGTSDTETLAFSVGAGDPKQVTPGDTGEGSTGGSTGGSTDTTGGSTGGGAATGSTTDDGSATGGGTSGTTGGATGGPGSPTGGTMASTGSDGTLMLAGTAAALAVTGAGAVALTRRRPRERPEQLLGIEAVSVVLGGRTAMRDASLTVAPGELVPLLGPNGAGKTTLLRAVLGLVSPRDSWTTDLSSFLFGQVLAVDDADIRRVAVMGAVLVAVVLGLRKELVALGLDRETARAAGLPVLRLDLTLYVVVTATIVTSLEAVGNVPGLALLITPAATARLLTERLWAMTLLASLFGCTGSLAGLYVSYTYDLAAGGSVVVLTALFALVWLLAPRHGLAAKLRARGGAVEVAGSGPGPWRTLDACADTAP